jgi:alkylation response protein AidB-like acyl-CoA dehydrogenase
MDLLRPVFDVVLDGVAVGPDARLAAADRAGAFAAVRDAALVMIAAGMLGGAEACLESAVAYAKNRVQFGRPIGVHQAIKHKCADLLFAVEATRSITGYAAWAVREGVADAATLAAMAKATASDAFVQAAQEDLQIHGGVGFTWEYDCHLFLKRARSDETWMGDAAHHRERIATLLRF